MATLDCTSKRPRWSVFLIRFLPFSYLFLILSIPSDPGGLGTGQSLPLPGTGTWTCPTVQVGEWGLTDAQGKALREYCLRGGFFMADDFHGLDEWYEFESRMKKAFPEYAIRDIEDGDAIFHTVYDLNDRYQIPGQAHFRQGYKSQNGPSSIGAHWRGIFDEKGRIMVAISYNSDVGDAWEYADDPRYPAKFADLAIRLGVNYIIYAMTH